MKLSGKKEVYLEIADKYREYIHLGVIRNGEKLPSIRTAAGELGVNPNTVARAYSVLEKEGYINSLPKKGVFVAYGTDEVTKQTDTHKNVISGLKKAGIDKQTVLNWITEVYGKDD